VLALLVERTLRLWCGRGRDTEGVFTADNQTQAIRVGPVRTGWDRGPVVRSSHW